MSSYLLGLCALDSARLCPAAEGLGASDGAVQAIVAAVRRTIPHCATTPCDVQVVEERVLTTQDVQALTKRVKSVRDSLTGRKVRAHVCTGVCVHVAHMSDTYT